MTKRKRSPTSIRWRSCLSWRNRIIAGRPELDLASTGSNDEERKGRSMIRFLCSGVRWLPMLVLVSCGGGGGGGGGNNGPAFSLSTSALTFSAISPGVTPTPQTVTGSVSGAVSGTLYITILVSGPSVTNVIVNVSGSTGTASVIPAKASTLGPGTHISTVKVFAC